MSESMPFSIVAVTGCVAAMLLGALYLSSQEKKRRQEGGTTEKDGDFKMTIDREKYPGGEIRIYFASQTGTAESFAQQLEREGPDHGFFIRVIDMEDLLVQDLIDEISDDDDGDGRCRAIILSATYGEGEPTDNAAALVQDIKENLYNGDPSASEESINDDARTILKDMDYTVFGLGNRQYEHYNSMGKFFDSSFEKMGAKRIYPLGLGDDDDDLEGDFETWKEKLWPNLTKLYVKDIEKFQKRVSVTAEEGYIPDCPFEITYHDNSALKNAKPIPLEQAHGSSRHYFTSFDCPVKVVRELRSDTSDGGSTVHVEIDISNAKGLEYHTADNLEVLPLNDPAIVESVAKSLNYDLDAVFSLEAADGHEWHGAPFPMPLTVRELLTRYLDLTSAPRRSDLKVLSFYCTDRIDRQALTRLASKEGKVEYKEKITDAYFGIVDLLKMCPSLSIPLEHFIDICHMLLPRYYTISSSSSVHPNTVHLTSVVTNEKRKDGTMFNGVCSTYLANLSPKKQTIRVLNRPSTFRLPSDSSKPILMIGPGTGVAPMRALLQEREYQRDVMKQKVGLNVLYFGCKKSNQDFIYKDEMQQWEKKKVLNKFYVAFSREQKEKVYVQHLLMKNAKETWQLINDNQASIYVCGGVKMGNDVTDALREIIMKHGNKSMEEAKSYLADLSRDGRFVQELWA